MSADGRPPEAAPSAGAREAARQACAHLRVSWRTRQLTSGHTEGWWECDTGCGERFVPPSFLESVAAARVAEERRLLGQAEKVVDAARRYIRWRRVGNVDEEREAAQLLEDALDKHAAALRAPDGGQP